MKYPVEILLMILGLIVTGCVAPQAAADGNGATMADNKLKAEQEYSMAYEYYKQSKFDDALLHVNEAVRLDKNLYAAYILLAQVQRAKRDIAAAESAYVHAQRVDPRDPRAYEGLATIYLVDYQDYGRAIGEYQTALSLDSTKVDVLNGLAAVYQAMKQYDTSLAYYFKSLQYEPENLVTVFAVAKVYADKGEPDQAVTYLESVKARKPEVDEVRIRLADAYIKLGRYSEAVEELKYLIAKSPDKAGYHIQLGSIYKEQKKYDSAAAEFKTAQQLLPDDPMPLLYQADVAITRNNLANAETLIRDALLKSPDNAYAYLLLGDIYKRRGYSARVTWEKKKTKANAGVAKTSIAQLNQAIGYYAKSKADSQFAYYATTEIERCTSWNKQTKEELWYIGVKVD